jgi:hypothetical protein
MADIAGIPVYKVRINEETSERTGIKRISLVDCPAIEENWITLAKEQPDFKLDSDKQLLFGPLLIPDKPIFRRFPSGKGFYVVFTKEEIEKISRKVMAVEKTIDLNYQHIQGAEVKGTVQEIWLSGTPDKSNKHGYKLPEGSLFVVAHIEDSKFWNDEVKSGNVKGFSIEAFLNLELKQMEKLVTAKTESGAEVFSNEETWIIGAEIKQKKDGKDEAVTDGEVKLSDGTLITVKGGKIENIHRAEEFSKEELAAIEKVFAPVLKKLEDRIAAIERMSAVSKTEKKQEIAAKKSAIQSSLEKLERLKAINNKINDN